MLNANNMPRMTVTTGASAHCGVLPPPPGVSANCDHPTTQTASNITLHTIMIVLGAISLSIRLYTRKFILRSVGLDDFLCILGLGLLVSYSATMLACGNLYLGHHIWDIPKADFIYGHKLEVISEWIYCVVSPVLKLAALWFYRRIFGPQTRVNYIINGGIFFITVAYTALFFISLLTCMPFERRWNPYVVGYCLPGGVTAYLSGAINVLTDAFVVFLPMPAILKLNMARPRKIRAVAVFGLGIIVLALSITRLAKTPMVFKLTDPTWELSNFAIYSILELYFGLICICFLASPSFLDRFGPLVIRRIRSSIRSSSHSVTSDNTLDAQRDTGYHDKGAHTVVSASPPSLQFITQAEGTSERDLSISVKQKDSTSSFRGFDESDQV